MHVLLFYNCVLTVVKYTDMLCYVMLCYVTVRVIGLNKDQSTYLEIPPISVDSAGVCKLLRQLNHSSHLSEIVW